MLGTVAQAYNPSQVLGRQRLGGLPFKMRDGVLTRPHLNQWQWLSPVITAMQGSTTRRIVIHASSGIEGDPTSEIINTKRTRSMAQVVEYLPNNLQYHEKKKNL
jgi:hypothetical protein